MQQKGAISPNARISMPVFDIDSKASIPNIVPEIDVISFNGQSPETLQGADNRWTNTNLQIDISVVSILVKPMKFVLVLPFQSFLRMVSKNNLTHGDDTTPGNVSPSSFFIRNIAVTESEHLLDNI